MGRWLEIALEALGQGVKNENAGGGGTDKTDKNPLTPPERVATPPEKVFLSVLSGGGGASFEKLRISREVAQCLVESALRLRGLPENKVREEGDKALRDPNRVAREADGYLRELDAFEVPYTTIGGELQLSCIAMGMRR